MGPEHEDPERRTVLALLALGLCVGAALTIGRLWAPLVLAAWTVSLARPLHDRAAKRLGGSQRAAAALTVGLVVSVLAPLTILGVSLSTQAVAVARQVLDSKDSGAALIAVFKSTSEPAQALPSVGQVKVGPREITDFMREHGAGTWLAL